MTGDDFAETAVDLFEDAPCGYVSTMPDGTILSVNRTFEALTGLERDSLVGRRRFQDLLPVAGQLYHETHYRPLLHVSGETREIALEIVCSDGSRLPVLVNSVLARDATGRPRVVRTVVFPARDRRRYEEELLLAQRRDHEVALRLQRNLLSGTLPQAPGLELAVGYSPGGSGLLAGGDWYDAFWVDPGNVVALVVGDVVGHGLEAAAAMGHLRSTTRALASVRRNLARARSARRLHRHAHGRVDDDPRLRRAGHPRALARLLVRRSSLSSSTRRARSTSGSPCCATWFAPTVRRNPNRSLRRSSRSCTRRTTWTTSACSPRACRASCNRDVRRPSHRSSGGSGERETPR